MIAVKQKKLHAAIIDELGNRYGRLTVLEYAGRGNDRHSMWKCCCDCGKEKIIDGVHLRKGRTQSCGCLQEENRHNLNNLPCGEASFNYLFRNIENGAKIRSYVFDLTKNQVRNLVTQNCHYCGRPPAQIANSGGANGTFVYNGIDRVNNDEGYIENNIVSCCKTCNFAKRSMGVEEFKSWLTRAYKHFVERDAQ